jgi:methyl-accepting chemotaxis protein
MESSPLLADPALTAKLRACSRGAAAVVILIPCAALLGWALEVDALKRVLPGLVAMNPLTALSLLAAGVSLLLVSARTDGSRLCGQAGAAAVAAVGALILLRYLTGANIAIDRVFFARTLGDNVMAPTTAFDFLLTGLALWRLGGPPARDALLSQILAVGAALVAILALTGYVYGVENFYRLRSFIAMALHTASAFLALALGLLCARPDQGLMARFTSRRAGGAMLRRLLFWQVAAPFAMGWLILKGYRLGFYVPALGFSLFVVGAIVFICSMTWRNAALLDREDGERSRAEGQLREAHAGLEATVQQRTGELTQAVAGIRESLRVLGASSEEMLESSSELAASAHQTASSVVETTTAVEQVRHTAQTASERARDVAKAAKQTAEISSAGTRATQGAAAAMQRTRETMRTLSESMLRLSEQSHAIAEIVSAVDELAEQSNLLAVNAAIEAAQAGEHGKGFAVVADQVKYLAGQSRQATKQVRTILNDIRQATNAATLTAEEATRAVDAGVEAASQAGNSIVSLTESIDVAAKTAARIAASSEQQFVGIEQVAQAMSQIRTASQKNVDQAKQLEGAAQGLNVLGQRLGELVKGHQPCPPARKGEV